MSAAESGTQACVRFQACLPSELRILGGLTPFPDEQFLVQAEVDAPPFLRLVSAQQDLAFNVLEPFEVDEEYTPELIEDDLRLLGLETTAAAGFLALVNLSHGSRAATINLAAPIAFNPATGSAKQVILRNAMSYHVRQRIFPD